MAQLGDGRRLERDPTTWIYLSPHLDDVAFSCGGLIRQQVDRGHDVSIWTVFTASPPDEISPLAELFRAVWGIDGDPMEWRKNEDAEACRVLGARQCHLEFLDVAYRWSDAAGGWLYASHDEITGRLHPVDATLIHDLATRLQAALPEDAVVVCPLTMGNHVDHRITRLAAERTGRSLVYYADYPYLVEHIDVLGSLESRLWTPRPHTLDEGAVRAWQDAALAHRSQISGYWTDGEDHLRIDIAGYARSQHGASLWYPPEPSTGGDRSGGSGRTSVPGLSFCILSGGKRPEQLRRLVASIHQQRLPSFEIIVGGDAEPHQDYRLVEAIEQASSGAVSVIRNQAAEHARCDHVVFCDDDIELDPGWYAGLQPYLGEYDALTSRLLNPDGTRHWDWSVSLGFHMQSLLSYGEIDRDLYLTGGLMIVRTDVWARHRWDENLGFNQAEDVEVSQRLIAAGRRVGICTRSSAVHTDDRYTQIGRHICVRSDRGVARRAEGALGSLPKDRLLEIAAKELRNGNDADAADCLRACLARDPNSLIANGVLDDLYRAHGGRIEGNDDWRLP